MPLPPNPQRGRPSTYFVQERSMEEELHRLQAQDRLVTAIMGGVLPEQPGSITFRRVLDVGCATGDWLIEVAKTYPDISLLVGVDTNERAVAYARGQAAAQQVSDRVEFHIMDALGILEFPVDYFDLVNQRFAWSFLRTWEWPKLLNEYQRITRPGGVIRITEADIQQGPVETNPALSHLSQLVLQAFYQAGHFFTPEWNGVTSQLARLMHQYGIRNVQTLPYILEYEAGTPEAQHLNENTKRFFRTVLPFLRKWTHVPEDYEAIYQQGLLELQRPDFVAIWSFLTAWGVKHE